MGYPSKTVAVVKPKIGAIDAEGNVWVGEKPSLKWDYTTNKRATSIFCYQIGKNMRQYKEIIQGMSVKFGNDDSYTLHTFANNLSRHLELHGMDTVFYIPYRNEVQNLINTYQLFSKERVKEVIKDPKDNFL
jgi:hypothetical protein